MGLGTREPFEATEMPSMLTEEVIRSAIELSKPPTSKMGAFYCTQITPR